MRNCYMEASYTFPHYRLAYFAFNVLTYFGFFLIYFGFFRVQGGSGPALYEIICIFVTFNRAQ
jgi:hypothetical protein